MSPAGIKTVYNKVFPAEVTDYTPIADAVAAAKAQVVVLGSVDVPTVAAFMQAFEQAHYNPKVFIATAGPTRAPLCESSRRVERQRRDGSQLVVRTCRKCPEPEDGR